MIRFVQPDKIGALNDWKKLGFIVGKAILPQIGAVESLLDFYDDVKKEYKDSKNSVEFLANQFCTACSKLQNDIEKNQKIIIFLYTSNLIPHPYSMGAVADFAKINPENLELACRLDCPVWGLLTREDYYDQFLRKTFEDCPTPKHITEKEFILNYLTNSWISIYRK
jgi:hypothetical protein